MPTMAWTSPHQDKKVIGTQIYNGMDARPRQVKKVIGT